MGRKRLADPRICPVCETEYYRPPSALRQTCSRTCAAVLRLRGENRKCKTCGGDFYAMQRDITKGYGNFCSTPCWAKSRERRVAVKCHHCSAEIERIKFDVEKWDRFFCDSNCRNDWQRRFQQLDIRTEKFTPQQRREWIGTECAKCGTTYNLCLDHIVPRFAGGPTTRENSQTLCLSCNSRKTKDDMLLYETLLDSVD